MTSIASIQATVARHYRIAPEAMLSHSRKRVVARPRQVAMYLARRFTRHPSTLIGRHFQRDHSTVLNAVRVVETLIEQDEDFDFDLARLRRAVRG